MSERVRMKVRQTVLLFNLSQLPLMLSGCIGFPFSCVNTYP